MMRTQVFSVDGDRPTVNNTAIIITDGLPTVVSTVPAEVDAVHAQGIATFAIGITNQVDENMLQTLSSAPHQVSYNNYVAPISFTRAARRIQPNWQRVIIRSFVLKMKTKSIHYE